MAVAISSTVILGATVISVPFTPDPSVNQTIPLMNWINAAPDGSTLDLNGLSFRSDGWGGPPLYPFSNFGVVVTGKTNLTIQNGTIYSNWIDPAGTIDYDHVGSVGSNIYRLRGFWDFRSCINLTIINLHAIGPHDPALLPSYHANVEAQHGFSFTSCIGVRMDNWSSTLTTGDGLYLGTVGSVGPSIIPTSDFIATDGVIDVTGRMGFAFACANGVLIDGLSVTDPARSLMDLEPNANMPDGSASVHDIEVTNVTVGRHTSNAVSTGSAWKVENINLHHWTALPGVSLNGFMGDPGTRLKNITIDHFTADGEYGTNPIGSNPVGGIFFFEYVDGVTFTNNDLTGQVGRGMAAGAVGQCTSVVAHDNVVTNGYGFLWNGDTGTAVYDIGWTPPGTAVVYDGFNKGYLTVNLIVADSGQRWVQYPAGIVGHFGHSTDGTVWNPLTFGNRPDNTVAIDSTLADCTINLTLPAVGAGGPCFRLTDDANRWYFDNGTGHLVKKVAGVLTTVSTSSAGANGDVVQVVLAGSSITVKRNGSTMITATDAFNSTATSHGLWLSDHTARLDDFSVVP